MTPFLTDRRAFLRDAGTGLGGIALAALLAEQGLLAADEKTPLRPAIAPDAPLAPRKPHFAPKAKRVLTVFCSGAVSHLDTFDYKPELVKRDGQPLPGGEKLVTFQGEQGNLVKPLWAFKPRGQSGKMVSDLLPNLAALADEMCFLHSLTAKSNTHGPAENQMSTGFTLDGFPSAGAWVSYALGSENRDLPAFVAIPDPRGVPQIGPADWSSGFLPAVFQGTAFSADRPIPNLLPSAKSSPGAEGDARSLLRLLNEEHLKRNPGDAELSARIASYELAARMQLSAPEAADLSRESKATHALYGTDSANPLLAGFARNCLLARRLLERGVRFVQVFNGAYAMGEGVGNWDGHRQLKKDYDRHGPVLDRPAAALLRDLKARGLLDDTLVVWGGEFGRTPTSEGLKGRDHHSTGFTMWLAGGGVKGGHVHGATDELGFNAVEGKVHVHDLHATVLHLLGFDHETFTYRYAGRDFRLTDVAGKVITEILA